MARRHLGFRPHEWDALPWYEKRINLEGLVEEFGDEGAHDAPAASGGSATSVADKMASFGARVRRKPRTEEA